MRGEETTADNCASQRVVIINRADANNSSLNASITQIKTDKNRIADGEGVTFTTSIQNNSVSPENNIFINYFRSSDNIITTGDIGIGSDFLFTLAANTTEDISLKFPLTEKGYYGVCVAGSRSVNNCSNAIFIEVIGSTWQQAVGNADWPIRDEHTSLVYDNKMWILGGSWVNVYRNDVWYSTNGRNWEQATGAAGWSSRHRHTSLVYDNKMWVLGGYDGRNRLNDVWHSTDGRNWEQATDNAGWSSRYRHTSLVYDNKMWVIGGQNDSNLNDVWYSRDGINWRQVTANAAWSSRGRHTSLAYDNKIWVLGGHDGSYKNDVWYSTDGNYWERARANTDWSARYSHTSLVYDNKIWVLGGDDEFGRINDIWHSTDGINWVQATANAAWRARFGHTSLVYDNKMWVLGGDFSTSLNDVWYAVASNNTIDKSLAISLTSSGNDYSSDAVVANLQAGAESYYKFQFNTGNYIIETSSDVGTSCILYNSERSIVMTDNNSGTEECSITHTVSTTTANFYLQVTGNTASTTGIYQLLIRKNTTNTGRTSIRIAANTTLQGTRQSGQKSALNAEFQPQVQGRLEVQDPITKEYGTVCGDSFGNQDVIVACRELGFSDGYVIPAAQIEDGTGAILLDDLHCIGDEESLLDCQHNGLKVHNCIHAEDIGIACY